MNRNCHINVFKFVAMAMILVLTNAYTLEGIWSLSYDELAYTKSDPRATFQFRNYNIVPAVLPSIDILNGPINLTPLQNGKSLIISACKNMQYNYYINESNIYLQFASLSSPIRPCLSNQADQIMERVNSTFKFGIIENKLILYYPNGSISASLSRNDNSLLKISPEHYQYWNLINIKNLSSGQSLNSSTSGFTIGNSSIVLCGNQSVAYKTQSINKLDLNVTSLNCPIPTLQNIILNTGFYLEKGRIMSLYDKKGEQIAQLQYLFEGNQTQIHNFINNYTKSKENIVINSNINPRINIKENKDTNSQPINSISQPPSTPLTRDSSTTPSQRPSTQGSSFTPSKSTSTQGSPTIDQTSLTQASLSMTINSQTDNVPLAPYMQNPRYVNYLKSYDNQILPDCKCTAISSANELRPFDSSLLQNKWYLYSLNGSRQNISLYYYYFMIITPLHIIYYGGCTVKWSTYNLIDGNNLTNLQLGQSPKPSCLKPNYDKIILSSLFNSAKYVQVTNDNEQAYLIFYDEKLNRISTFSTQSQPYSSTWS